MVVVAAIPNLLNLWEVSSAQPYCYKIWETFSICQTLLGRHVTDQQRLAFYYRWERANQTIQEVVESYARNVKFQEALATFKFEWHHISPKDCFHPSVAGQNLLSDIAW